MTRKEFRQVQVGSFISDSYNGVNRVWLKEKDCIYCRFVEYDVESQTWKVTGLSSEVTLENAINESNGNRWNILTDKEIKEIESDYINEYNKIRERS